MIHGEPVKRVVQRFFLFWSAAARNSPACKGKSLRCLRKCRFAYIDISPALSARRHLTAALRPSRLHLSLTAMLSNSSDMVRSRTSRSRPLFSAPNSKLFTGNYGCNRKSHLAHGTPQDGAWNRMRGLCVAVAQVAKVKAGCVAHRSEETEDFNFKRFNPCKERGSPLTVNMGVEE